MEFDERIEKLEASSASHTDIFKRHNSRIKQRQFEIAELKELVIENHRTSIMYCDELKEQYKDHDEHILALITRSLQNREVLRELLERMEYVALDDTDPIVARQASHVYSKLLKKLGGEKTVDALDGKTETPTSSIQVDSKPPSCNECEIGIADPTLDECKDCPSLDNPTLGDGIPTDARYPATDKKPPRYLNPHLKCDGECSKCDDNIPSHGGVPNQCGRQQAKENPSEQYPNPERCRICSGEEAPSLSAKYLDIKFHKENCISSEQECEHAWCETLDDKQICSFCGKEKEVEQDVASSASHTAVCPNCSGIMEYKRKFKDQDEDTIYVFICTVCARETSTEYPEQFKEKEVAEPDSKIISMESKCPGCGWEQLEFFYHTRETYILVKKEDLSVLKVVALAESHGTIDPLISLTTVCNHVIRFMEKYLEEKDES